MRNLKKVLVLVLSLAMMLSIMVVGAGAAFADQDSIDSKHQEAVDMAVALNIINGIEQDGKTVFKPTDNVTREQMAKMICILDNGGKEPQLATGSTFSDVAADRWSNKYIESCASRGVVAGVGGGKFNPQGDVTGSQAAKMLLVELGYKEDIQKYTGSGWDTNVNIDATKKGYYDGLEDIDVSAPLSREHAAQMIWNALQAKEIGYNNILVTDPVTGQLTSKVDPYDKGDTLLEDKFDAQVWIGTFDGNKDTGAATNKGDICVNGTLEEDVGDSSVTPVAAKFPYNFDISYIGEEVKVVFKDGTSGVKYQPDKYDAILGVTLTGATGVVNSTQGKVDDLKTADQQIKIDGTKYDVADTVKVYTNYATATADVDTYTGTQLKGSSSANSALTTALQANTGDTIKFVQNIDGEIISAYIVKAYPAYVSAVSSDKVTVAGPYISGTLKIADNDVYDGIAKDDVVVVTPMYVKTGLNSDGKNIVEKAEAVSGQVTGYKAQDKITMGGTVYDVYGHTNMVTGSFDSDATAAMTAADINEDFDLYMVNGYVGVAVQTSESASNYSLVIDENGGTAGSDFDPLKAQVMDASGTKSTIVINDKGAKSVAVGDIITYTGSADNAKVKVEAPYSATPGTFATTYDKTAKTFNGKVTAGNCVLFRDTDSDFDSVVKTDTFKAGAIRDMKTFSAAANTYTFVEDSDGKIVAVFVGKDTTTTKTTTEVVIGIVSDSVGVVKMDDTDYNQYTVVNDKKEYTVNIEVATGTDHGVKDVLAEGSIYAFSVASDNLYTNNNDFVVLSAAATYSGASKTIDGDAYTVSAVGIKSYDAGDKLVTYYPDVTDTTAFETKALNDDAVIFYIDTDEDVAGSDIGVATMNEVTPVENAIILVDSDNTIAYMVIETSGDAAVWAQ